MYTMKVAFFAACVCALAVSSHAGTDNCTQTFQIFLTCADKRMKAGDVEEQLEDELNADFSRMVKRCFSPNGSTKASTMCPLSAYESKRLSSHGIESATYAVNNYLKEFFFDRQPSTKQCIRRNLYNSFPNYIRSCYKKEMRDPKAEPESLPDIDGDAFNISDAVYGCNIACLEERKKIMQILFSQETYKTRVIAYSSIAECARENLPKARATSSCMVSPSPRLYNRHCIKLMAGCLFEALSSTGLPCIEMFGRTKKAMCNCALLHRKEIMRNMLKVDKLMRSGLPADVCRARITDASVSIHLIIYNVMLDIYVVAVEMAFKSCLHPTDPDLPVRAALIEACANDSSELKRMDAVQAAFTALSFFQAAIDRFDRFCQADCPHEALLQILKSTKGK
ncbi:hypothetical protein D918_03312 [Trichuris suis]|nr:hypothetical protein D918_03312 [Trichuris suis]